MKKSKIIWIGLALLIAMPNLSYGQYLNRLYDYDSTYDWGWDIFINTDNTFFVVGSTGNNPFSGIWSSTNMTVSSDGNTVLSRKRYGSIYSSLYNGDQGEVKKLANGDLISVVSVNTPNTTYNNSAAGFMKMSSNGDSIFLKTHTDTSKFYEFFYACAVTENNKFLGGGGRGLNGVNRPSTVFGYLVCADSTGDTIWAKTYQKDTTQYSYINRTIALNNRHIVLGAQSTAIVYYPPTSDNLLLNAPWFMELDSVGNILKDTLYDYHAYVGGGSIFKDKNGGYIHFGAKYSITVASDPNDYENFPNYVAHLDTNFRIEWIVHLPYTSEAGHRYISKVLQLQDGDFIVCGVSAFHGKNQLGWSTKISPTGTIKWERYYISDSSQNIAQLKDVTERPDGNLIFVGSTMNDTLASWHTNNDIWLIEADSNGCEMAGCSVTAVKESPVIPKDNLTVFPNPNTGSFTIRLSAAANEPMAVIITSITGATVQQFTSTTNKDTEVVLHMPPGMYLISVSTTSGRWVQKMVVE